MTTNHNARKLDDQLAVQMLREWHIEITQQNMAEIKRTFAFCTRRLQVELESSLDPLLSLVLDAMLTGSRYLRWLKRKVIG
jgi:hypothetical protein